MSLVRTAARALSVSWEVSQPGPGRVRPERRRLADWWCPGQAPAQGREVADRWEHGHVKAALGDQDLRGLRLDAGNRGEQLDDVRVRGEHELDPRGEVLQRHVERVDVRQQLRDHHPVVLDREAALERFAELWDLRAHLALRELGELIGIADP